jgi:hypothetical protein
MCGPVTEHRSKRGGVPWWTPLLALALLIAAVAAGIAETRNGSTRSTVVGAQHHVLAAKKTVGAPKRKAAPARATGPLVAGSVALLPVPAQLTSLAGRFADARGVPVREVVGPDIFWVGKNQSQRLLVHLQGGNAKHPIRMGQRLDFRGVVVRNRAGSAARWGLTAREGAHEFTRQAAHLEVYAPHIRFASR